MTATWFNRAWLADKLTPGTRLLLRGKLEKRGFNVAEHELLGGAEGTSPAGIHTTGLVPVHPASERLRPQKLREWAWQAAPLAVNALEPLPPRQRAQDGMPGSPTPWSLRTSRPTRARPPRPAGVSPSRSCCSTRPRSAPGAVAAPRAGRGTSIGASGRASRALARLAAVRADGRPARGARRRRRRPRRARADAAAADGRGRLRQDRASPSTRCCARSRPGTRPR